MRVQFEATIADFAEASFHAWRRENSFSQRFLPYIYGALLLAGIASVPVFMFLPKQLWIGIVEFALISVVCLWLYRPITENYYKKLCSDASRKYMGNRNSTKVEIELLEKGLRWISKGDEYIFAWQNISKIEEAKDAIYFFRKDAGAVAVPKHALISAEQTARFLAFANSYQKSAQQLLND
jgi:hypothetical protein